MSQPNADHSVTTGERDRELRAHGIDLRRGIAVEDAVDRLRRVRGVQRGQHEEIGRAHV